jgi:hypothetical protein
MIDVSPVPEFGEVTPPAGELPSEVPVVDQLPAPVVETAPTPEVPMVSAVTEASAETAAVAQATATPAAHADPFPFRTRPPVAAPVVSRDYDYFSELEARLADLAQDRA